MQVIKDELLLKEEVGGERLHAYAAQTILRDDGHLCSPIGSPAYAVHGNAGLVDFRAGGKVVEDREEHAFRCGAGLDGRLTGARAIDGEVADAEGKDGGETFRQVFLAAVEAVYGEHQGHRTCGSFGQAQVADDLLAFEGDVDDFKRWIHEARMGEIGVDSLLIGDLLSGRSRRGPAAKGVKPPGANEVGVRLFGIGHLQRFALGHVAVCNADEGVRPLVSIFGLDGFESFANVIGVKADEWIAADLGAVNSFDLDLIDGSFLVLLSAAGRRYRGSNHRQHTHCNLFHHSCFLL